MVTARRSNQPSVENSDTYIWSSTKTWLRSMESRSRYSGRSWWGDGRHRGLQPGHMRLQGDGYLVPETALHAGADGLQKPGGEG